MKGYKTKVITGLLAGAMMLGGISCKKKQNSSSTATMSATINNSQQSFSVTISNSNGATIVQGNNSNYTLTIVLKTISAGIYNLADPSGGYYATVSNNLGYSYSTDGANMGKITLTQSGSLYNGTFYFTANETSPSAGGGNINITSGSCGNI